MRLLRLGGEGEAPLSPEVTFGERTPSKFAGGETGGPGKMGSSLEPDGLPVVGLGGKDLFWLGLPALSLTLIRGGLVEAGKETGSPLGVVRSLAIR